MLYPVEKLIEGRGAPLCVREDETVRDALVQMVEHNFSQLPIIDGQGNLRGIISEQSIARSYYHVGDGVSVLDLKVTACSDRLVTLPIERDIFDVLDRLQGTDAIVIVEGSRPIGILTNYDITSFFRDVSEGFIMVEDIEVTLRQFMDEALSTTESREQAILNAFKHRIKDDGMGAPDYERMTIGDYINLITNSKNWIHFEQRFDSKDLFKRYMEQVRDIRNQLAHFRGELDAVQHDVLTRARSWLDSCRRSLTTTYARSFTADAIIAQPRSQHVAARTDGKYAPLEHRLRERRNTTNVLQLDFSEIESLLSEPLPDLARKHRAWWANDASSGRHALAWMQAGWKVEDVDFGSEQVTFRRTDTVLYQLFFADLLERLKRARPGLTRATKTYPQNWWSFGGGRSGFTFAWVFGAKSLLRVELYIDTGERSTTKKAFDLLQAQKGAIEREAKMELKWQRLNDARASRICVTHPVDITANLDDQEKVKHWALEAMLVFVEVLRPRIRNLHLPETTVEEAEQPPYHGDNDHE